MGATGISFDDILVDEHRAINMRREAHGKRPDVQPLGPKGDSKGEDRPVYDTSGVALSGGGIRSAAFCLGALQSLATNGLIDKIDYLSTVSGGGYIGASVSAAMSRPAAVGANQDFPFAAPTKIKDTIGLQHLRDYSNYILPRGGKSVADAVAVVLRGLAANLIFIVGTVFLLAWLMVVAYPASETLTQGSLLPRLVDVVRAPLGWDCPHRLFGLTLPCSLNAALGAWPFALTLWAFLALLAFLALWALVRSADETPGTDIQGAGIYIGHRLVIAFVIIVFLDIQPVAVAGLFTLKAWSGTGAEPAWLKETVAVLTILSSIAAFFRDKLATLVAPQGKQQGGGALVKRVLAHAVIWFAALALPLVLWLVYLAVCMIGITVDDGFDGRIMPAVMRSWLDGWNIDLPVAELYFFVGLAFSVAASFLSANANSLHRLYRDKLSKAFLFDPKNPPAPLKDGDELAPLDTTSLTDIAPASGGPYHLINAAVNLQGSKYANRRGRNAGFFTFSADYVGGEATGYAHAAHAELADGNINLGTAMAISGAAVSSNMGSNSMAALAPTLALLNVRLGYWMLNPRFVVSKGFFRSLVDSVWNFLGGLFGGAGIVQALRPGKIARDVASFTASQIFTAGRNVQRFIANRLKSYLFAEMFGQLDENSTYIYLTDGGHIENLGLYALLKRHCKVIIVVDGESDPTLEFPALCKLERYARIDLGVRIDLPWQPISVLSNAITALAEDNKPIPAADGPHCALGVIHYPGDGKGVLLYVKSSLTGDEPDYIMNYKKHNPSFPHESTGDQFFTEEQFENYRALGFHALDGFLTGSQTSSWALDGPWAQEPAPPVTPKTVADYFLKQFVAGPPP